MMETRRHVAPLVASLASEALFVAAARSFAHPLRNVRNVELVLSAAVSGLDGAAIAKGLDAVARDRDALRRVAALVFVGDLQAR